MKFIHFRRVAVAVVIALTPGWAPPAHSQLHVAASKISREQAGASVEALADFIRERAGVELGQSVKTRLAEMEWHVRSGAGRRLRADELADILTHAVRRRLSTLTDQEIEQAARSCRDDRSYVGPTWGAFDATPEECAKALARLRAQSRRADGRLSDAVRAAASGRGSEGGVEGLLKLYGRLLPEHFGSALEEGLTPLQSLLIAYAVASDDPIHWPLSRLRAEMEHAHQWKGGDEFPDPAGRVAFGPRGYLFPTPLDLIFNGQTMNDLLDQMGEKIRN